MAAEICELCGVEHINLDDDEHTDRHVPFLRAFAELGYRPMPYRVREYAKDIASRYADNVDVERRTVAVLLHVRAWFDRSLLAAIDRGVHKQHPTFGQYLTMMTFREEEFQRVQRAYGVPIDGCAGAVKLHYSYWYLPEERTTGRSGANAALDGD